MSEYQYYEFCKINAPLTAEERKKMSSLSSRTSLTTHTASYVYHYSDFRGNSRQLLLKYFDVFFYISNWGSTQLTFKYPAKKIDETALKKYSIRDVIVCKKLGENLVLDIFINKEEGCGWIEGEGLLADFLPLYEEIKKGDCQFLRIVSAINEAFSDGKPLKKLLTGIKLSPAQKKFIRCVIY